MNARTIGMMSSAILFALAGCKNPPGDFWMNGTRGGAIPHGRFIEITGDWQTFIFTDGKHSDYTICIAIIIPTDPSRTGYKGQEGNGYDRRTWHSVLTWKPPTGNKSLAYDVDGIRRTIRIADQSFDLMESNFFVVIFDPAWLPTITQVRDKADIPSQLPADTLVELQKQFASKVRKR